MVAWEWVAVILSVASNIAFFVAQEADAKETTKGIDQGGFEGNDWIVHFFTSKPTLNDLNIYNLARWGVWTVAFIVLDFFNLPLGLAGHTALGIGLAVGHYNGYKEWKQWLASGS